MFGVAFIGFGDDALAGLVGRACAEGSDVTAGRSDCDDTSGFCES